MTCPICMTGLDSALSLAGIATHPTCSPGEPLTGPQLRDALALLANELGTKPTDPPPGTPTDIGDEPEGNQ